MIRRIITAKNMRVVYYSLANGRILRALKVMRGMKVVVRRTWVRSVMRLIAVILLLGVVLPLEAMAQAEATGGPSMFQFILGTVQFAAIGFFVYYMLVLLPKNAQENEHKKFLENLKKNDEVVTSGGLLGKVVQVREDSITLELSSSVKVRVLPSHVRARGSVAKTSEVTEQKAANNKE